MNNKPTRSVSGSLSNTKKEEEDVSCWNCFTTNSDNEVEPVPLHKIREEQRKKFKLYPFLASDLSKPKVVTLKQKVDQHYSVAKKLEEKVSRNTEVAEYLKDNMEIDESENKQYLPYKATSSTSQTPRKGLQFFSSHNTSKMSQSDIKRDKSTETDIVITITKLTRSDSSSSSSTTPDFRPRRKILAKPKIFNPKINDTVSNISGENYFKSVSRDFVNSDIQTPSLVQKSKASSQIQSNATSVAQKMPGVETRESKAKPFSDSSKESRNFPNSATRLSEMKKIPSRNKSELLCLEKKTFLPESTKMISPKTALEDTRQETDMLKQNVKEKSSVEKTLVTKKLSTKHAAAIETPSSHSDHNVSVLSANKITKPSRDATLKQLLNEYYTIDKKIDETIVKYTNLSKSNTKSVNIELEKSKPETVALQNENDSRDDIVAKPTEPFEYQKKTNAENISPNESTDGFGNITYETYECNENEAFVSENCDNFNKPIASLIKTSTPKSESKIFSKTNEDVSDSVTNDIDEIIEKCANLSLAEKSKNTIENENIKSITLSNESSKTLIHSSIIEESDKKLVSTTNYKDNNLDREDNKSRVKEETEIVSSKSSSIMFKNTQANLKKTKNVSKIPVKILEKQDNIDETSFSAEKADNVSVYGSESGYAGSSGTVQDFHENEVIKKEIAEKVVKKDNSYKSTSSGNLKSQQLKSSLPVLNKIFDKKNFKTSSISRSLNIDINKSGIKPKRWSTLSVSSKPLSSQEDVYASDTLSSGNATLPRRSSSPLPHERDLDRERFPINRSGLQARSESMASVYSGAGEGARGSVAVRGEVQFSLLYNYRLGALEVGVKRCRDLAPVDTKRNRSDPYVKVYLLPDKSKAGKRKTKVKKNTLNPVFEETLSFVQPLASLSARTLWLSVWHADMFGRNDFLGEVALPLADVVFDDPAPTWYRLHERTEHFDEQQGTRGDLIIGLKFESQDNSSRGKGTLHVLVKEAKNLVATKPNGLADVFCKSYLLPERGRLAKQKTTVVRRTLNPRWEHTFTYRGLTMQELATRALELSLWDRDRLASNDFMGAIRLSLGTGTYMGASVNWMDSMGKEVALWQTMMQRPNFWVEGSLPLRPQLNN